MPCAPGLRPVKADVHAQSVIGGQVDLSVARRPRSISDARAGSRPASIIGSITSNVAESHPRTTTRGATESYSVGDGLGVIVTVGDTVGDTVGVGVGVRTGNGSTRAPSSGTLSKHTLVHRSPVKIVSIDHL